MTLDEAEIPPEVSKPVVTSFEFFKQEVLQHHVLATSAQVQDQVQGVTQAVTQTKNLANQINDVR